MVDTGVPIARKWELDIKSELTRIGNYPKETPIDDIVSFALQLEQGGMRVIGEIFINEWLKYACALLRDHPIDEDVHIVLKNVLHVLRTTDTLLQWNTGTKERMRNGRQNRVVFKAGKNGNGTGTVANREYYD